MKKAEKKFAELILYVARKCEDDNRFGATKLNKILFYSDLIHYGRTGQAITGVEYMRLENGPAPRRLLPIRSALERKHDLAIQEVDYMGRTQKRPIALREPDLSQFTGSEIATVDEVIDALWDANATVVSEFSHRFPGWQVADDGETIPYESIFIGDRPLTQAEKDHARELAG